MQKDHTRFLPDGKAPAPRAPLWETMVIFGSFVGLWAWWLARQNAFRQNDGLHLAWNLLLVALVVALVFVFVRRARRAVAAMRDVSPPRRRRG